jgi:hypothetical protein
MSGSQEDHTKTAGSLAERAAHLSEPLLRSQQDYLLDHGATDAIDLPPFDVHWSSSLLPEQLHEQLMANAAQVASATAAVIAGVSSANNL